MAKYGPKAQAAVQRELKAMEQGRLRSGGSGKKVTSRKQAIAIALSEARKAGAKMPPAPKGTASAKKRAVKKTAVKKSAAKKAPAKRSTATKSAATKSTARKTATKKSAAKKSAAKKSSPRTARASAKTAAKKSLKR